MTLESMAIHVEIRLVENQMVDYNTTLIIKLKQT